MREVTLIIRGSQQTPLNDADPNGEGYELITAGEYSYEDGTAAYIEEIGRINSGIAEFADNVIECVYGIPAVLKGGLACSGRLSPRF